MYLSEVIINPARTETPEAVNNPHTIHKHVLSAFPTANDHHPLWRLDLGVHKHRLYVLSGSKPDFTGVVERLGWPEADESRVGLDYGPVLDSLAEGDRYFFTLKANTVRSLSRSTKRVALRDTSARVDWLADRSGDNGFAVTRLDTATPDTARFRKHSDSERYITLATTLFTGELVVTDEDDFRAALSRGIGRGKAYGAGLITIERVRQ